MKTILEMYGHLNWANQRIIETLEGIDGKNEEALRLFAHILLAEKVWLTRLQGLDSSQLLIWSDVDIEGCRALVLLNKESFTTLFSNLRNTDLEKVISYKNSKGKEFKNTVRHILIHLAIHGQYHRGQINSRLRGDGFEPVNVDFITFVR